MIECFIHFLKDNNAFDEYVEECKTSDIRSLLLEVKDNLFISGFFIWNITKNDYTFWVNLNIKWLEQKDEYKQIRRNELIEKILC